MMTVLRRRPLVFSLLTVPLLWLAYPGGGTVWPLLAVALVPLLACLPQMSGRRTALAGFLTGVGHYLLLLYWIVIVLGHYGGLPPSLAGAALLLLACYMAFYLMVFAILARLLLLRLPSVLALFGVPALWVGLDWLRGTLFTGFPWMDIGYALAREPRLIQVADLFGHGGISFLIVFINVLAAMLLGGRRGMRKLPLVVPAVLVVAAAGYYSQLRWQSVGNILHRRGQNTMTIGVVQGNIDESVKWSAAELKRTVDIYLDNSRTLCKGKSRPELVAWPETALPFYPPSYAGMWKLYNLSDQYGLAVLTGAPWYEIKDIRKRDIRYYNSAQLLVPGGRFAGSYYKSHLVPFGEYVPLRRWLPFLKPLVQSVGDFTPGHVEKPLVWRRARLGVLICFESIFPDIARKWAKNGANVLVNLTNDGWYGKSSAPYQSMAMSIFRAVETRRSLVRSANTGISGFVDPLGRVIESSPIFTTWARAHRVVLMHQLTPFVRWGYGFPPVCLVLGIALAMTAAIRKNSPFPPGEDERWEKNTL